MRSAINKCQYWAGLTISAICVSVAFNVLAEEATPTPDPIYIEVGLSSDYLWRGVSRSGGYAAISTGAEYVFKDDWYAGVWISNSNEPVTVGPKVSNEVQWYGGYTIKDGSFGYDMGVMYFSYLSSPWNADFIEAYFTVDFENYAFNLATSQERGLYMEGRVRFDLPRALRLDLSMGIYNRVNVESYANYTAKLIYKDYYFMSTYNDLDIGTDNGTRFAVGWRHSFNI